jgi:DNA-binding NarL/FixJ family response regulator
MLRILIADDHEVVRSGLRSLLEARPGWEVIGEAADGMEAVRKATELEPDVAILDYGLPLVSGAGAARQIRARAPSVRILIFTMHENEGLFHEILAVGVRGYLLKSDAKEHLYAAVEAVAEGRSFFTGSVSTRLLDSFLTSERTQPDLLTGKERVVAQLIAEGKSNKESARILNLSIKTIETHRANTMNKLGISSTAALVRYTVRTKLIEP